jgi:hypothetical protein
MPGLTLAARLYIVNSATCLLVRRLTRSPLPVTLGLARENEPGSLHHHLAKKNVMPMQKRVSLPFRSQ